jgi:hypothetical protein
LSFSMPSSSCGERRPHGRWQSAAPSFRARRTVPDWPGDFERSARGRPLGEARAGDRSCRRRQARRAGGPWRQPSRRAHARTRDGAGLPVSLARASSWAVVSKKNDICRFGSRIAARAQFYGHERFGHGERPRSFIGSSCRPSIIVLS